MSMRDQSKPDTDRRSNRLNNIVIVGGGTAGWMTACAVSRYLGRTVCKIVLIESEEIGPIGVGEATIPPITKFINSLGISNADMINATGATFKLGIKFNGWARDGDSYLHPFGSFGGPVDGVRFENLFLRLAGQRRCREIWRYAPCAVAATEGRFGPDLEDAPSENANLPYAFHFDAKRFAGLLRAKAEANGVTRIEGRIVGAETTAGIDRIEAVRFSDGRRLDGNLFIDCSGAQSLLIGQQLGVEFLDWGSHLPCDRAVVAPTAAADSPALFTQSTAHDAGWQWRIPLQHRHGNGYVYSSNFSTDVDAEDAFTQRLGSKYLVEPTKISFRTGRRSQFWRSNVVAIGLSAGFLEPLESTSIHLTQLGISKLLELWPDRDFVPSLSMEYNRQMTRAFESARDFIILHYKANSRQGIPLWDHMRETDVPTLLDERIGLFRETGNIVSSDYDMFSVRSWFAVMLGQGIVPKRYNALADGVNIGRLEHVAEQYRLRIAKAVSTMPLHGEYLASLIAN